jgi:hypothetical protein
VAHHAGAGIARQHALEALRRVVGAVRHDDHARVDRVADADAAAVMDADPRRARGDVEERVQDRPVGDRVRPVAHRLRLAIGGRDGARIEMVATDRDRGAHAPAAYELVDRQPGNRTVAEAEPADPRGEPLERHALGCQLEPALKERIVREELPQRVVDRGDVGWVARERGPPERSDTTTEERPDIGRDEARV